MHQHMTRTPRRIAATHTTTHHAVKRKAGDKTENGRRGHTGSNGDVAGALIAFAGVMQVTKDPSCLRCRRPLLDRCVAGLKEQRTLLARLLADHDIQGELVVQVRELHAKVALLARSDGGVLTVTPSEIEAVRLFVEALRCQVHTAVKRARDEVEKVAGSTEADDDDEPKKKGKKKEKRGTAQLRVSLAGLAREFSGRTSIVAAAEQATDEGNSTEAVEEVTATTPEPTPAQETTAAVTIVELTEVQGGPCGNPCGVCARNSQCPNQHRGDSSDGDSHVYPGDDPYQVLGGGG